MMATKARILIVEDDPKTIRLYQRILGRQYHLEIAVSGEHALEMFPRFRPDLVLLDVAMTGIDGCEVCRRIRADSRSSLTKILFVSGMGVVEERLRAYKAGADDFITKPFNNEELKAKVQVFLRMKRAEEVEKIKDDLLLQISRKTENPLAQIIGMADILLAEEEVSESNTQCLDTIRRNAFKLYEFVNKTTLLCDLKKPHELKLAYRSSAEQAGEVVESMREGAGEREVTIDLDIRADAKIEADWELLCKALEYVIENAVECSSSGGKVTIVVDKNEEDCVLGVIDRGPGIGEEDLRRIFDTFATGGVGEGELGAGLGLAVARQVMVCHTGSVKVESRLGKGSTFSLSLPLRRMSQPPEPPE